MSRRHDGSDISRLGALAARHFQAGRLAEAEDLYQRLLRARPRDHDAQHILGVIALRLGRPAEAVDRLRRAIALAGRDALVHLTLGVALKALGQLDERIAAYRAAVRLDPRLARAWSNLGAALLDADDAAGAEAACRRALELAPDDDSEALASRGEALRRLGRVDEAMACLLGALARWPDRTEAAVNLGLLLQNEGGRAEADACFARALAIDPACALAHWNRGLLRLGAGDLATGWAGYGWRFATPALHQPRRLTMPAWRGEDLTGKRVLAWREQGLGDELMFASCLPDLLARAGHVIIECDRRLVELFARSFPQATVCADGAGAAVAADLHAQVHVAMGSLPQGFRPGLAAFPGRSGWLVADPRRVARWRERLAALGPAPKIGIGWRSGLVRGGRTASYTRLADWGPILGIPGLTFINLQYGRADVALADAERRFGVTIHRWPEVDLKDDLEETAALTAALDLVIAAPTSVGEMAGALGVPVWRCSPGGDWSALGTAVRPWYPAMRLYQARPGEGLAGVIERVGRDLRALARQ